ncbi:MAG: lipopolysaccharide heptosyltransferase I [Rhodoferax sp.]
MALRVLIVKLSSLGDVVHAMPAVQDVLRAVPGAEIDWVVERPFAALVRRCAGVHRVIPMAWRRWRHTLTQRQTWHEMAHFKAELQARTYDAVIDLQGLSKSALVARLARLSPQGVRYAMGNRTEGSSYEAPTRWLAQCALPLPWHCHAVARARLMCAQALGYTVPHQQLFGLVAQTQKAPEALKNVAIKQGLHGVVALVHGSSRADKQWPLAHWRALVAQLQQQGWGVALPHGSDAEQAVAQQIAQGFEHAQVWPRLDLDALVDALAQCQGAIGVDSGLSHIAVALGLPHVQLYNFDTAWRTGPPVWKPQPVAPVPQHPAAIPALRQCSVYAQPCPSVDGVFQAWLNVSATVAP